MTKEEFNQIDDIRRRWHEKYIRLREMEKRTIKHRYSFEKTVFREKKNESEIQKQKVELEEQKKIYKKSLI